MTVKKESENKKPHNPHEKHRSRMFDKVKNGHVGSLTDVELLEMSLFYVIPRSNTNVTAHNLMDKYTSLKNLFSADCASLSEIDGIGPSSACFFRDRRRATSQGLVRSGYYRKEDVLGRADR